MKQSDNENIQIDEAVRQTLLKFTQDNFYMRNLKIEILDMKQGFVKAKMLVTKEILNPYGSVHGGCLYSLADIVTGVAACTYGYYSLYDDKGQLIDKGRFSFYMMNRPVVSA